MRNNMKPVRVIRASDRVLNKPVNIQTSFKESPDVNTLFQGETFNGNSLMKEMAQLQIMYQFVCEENLALKTRLGMLAESLRGVKDRDQLIVQMLKYHDMCMEKDKKIIRLEAEVSSLKGGCGNA